MDPSYTDIEATSSSDSASDTELLEEIRERYRQYDDAWSDSRKERNTDIKYINGDPWHADAATAAAAKARADNGRPVMNSDALGQYVNQCVNSVRQNKRGIKVDPSGAGSDDASANLRQDLIRTIEYESDAPSIYAAAFQDMVEGSYAFFRITRRYVSSHYLDPREDLPRLSLGLAGGRPQAVPAAPQRTRNQSLFDQEIVIKPISNPNSVLYDPTCKEPDWSDARACFVLERVPKKDFQRRWPRATLKSFSPDYRQDYGDWFSAEDVLVAEYWRVQTKPITVYLLDTGEVTDTKRGNVIDKRKLEQKIVRHYITNGMEILERGDEPEPGTLIPIIPMIGLERWVDEGGMSKRVLFSLVRLARDPQMALAYLISQEMEEAGLTPKTPFIGYKGQFDSSRNQWRDVTKIPVAFLEADIPDNWPAGQVPPLPTRVPFTPNFQAYEIAKDSFQRAIQSAMGIMPLPTAAQRATEKSGVALQRIQNEEAQGSYHFIDGYDRALRLAGRVIDQWIPAVYGGERHKHVRKVNDSYSLITLNTGAPYQDGKAGKPVHYSVEDVDHSISISTGPSYQSQREAVSDFLDSLIAQLPKLPIAPAQAAQLLSIAIKMKNLGPQGDEMAEIISPTPGGDGDQSAQMLQQAQAKLQEQTILLQQLQSELQKLQFEKQAKLIDRQYDLAIEKLKAETQLAVAETNTKAQEIKERSRIVADTMAQIHDNVHEAGVQGREHTHEKHLAAQQLAHDAMLQAREQMHERDQAELDRSAAAEGPQLSPENEQ